MGQACLNFTAYQPLQVAYGIGVDSTSALVGMRRLGIRPDFITSANVGGPYMDERGGEKIETYRYIDVINNYLDRNGFPLVTVVYYEPKDFKNWPPYHSLEENCLTNGTLPSLAFGFKSCSLKWKAAAQHKFMQQQPLAIAAWQSGIQVRKVIGYDAGPKDMRRCADADKALDPLYEYWYPLVEWGWDRERCIEEIRREGLPVPPKSSCFFCPAMKEWEVRELPPEKLKRIVIMEARAKPRLNTVEGLWRKSTKKRPGMMTEFIRREGLLPAAEIDRLIEAVPKEIVLYQTMYDQHPEWRETMPTFGDFVQILIKGEQTA